MKMIVKGRRGMIFLLLYLFGSIPLIAVTDEELFRIVFYNVENLFDSKKDSTHSDDEFLPAGSRRWTNRRYRTKLVNLSKVIVALGGPNIPALVGVCEVENDSVLYDLTRRTPLRALGYSYVVGETADRRGIRNALLYQPERGKLLESRSHSVQLSGADTRGTRHLLHVTFRLISRDTLDVIVCHSPSRSGGMLQTEAARMSAARRLKSVADSLFLCRARANIVIMGDFNDGLLDRSIVEGVAAKRVGVGSCDLQSLYSLPVRGTDQKVGGSYKFQSIWYQFDQMMVSGGLLSGDGGVRMASRAMSLFAPSFLLQTDETRMGVRPFSTYYGRKYNGGFSDHLPIWIDLRVRTE